MLMLIFLIPILFSMFLNSQLTHCHLPLPHSHSHGSHQKKKKKSSKLGVRTNYLMSSLVGSQDKDTASKVRSMTIMVRVCVIYLSCLCLLGFNPYGSNLGLF